jgi:hypothetical protein
MHLVHETTMITGYRLMNCAQYCSFHLTTMYVKHILLIVALAEVAELHSFKESNFGLSIKY